MRLSASRKGIRVRTGRLLFRRRSSRLPGVRTKEVERKTFDPQADRFEARPVGFACRQVDVRMRVSARCLTPVGEVALSAAGAVDGLQLSSAASRTVSVDADAEVEHGRR